MFPSVSEVSIITVNWNGKAHLESLLPTLLPLGSREIIVVDNGSTDGSVRFVREHFPSVRVVVNRENEGFSHPNNKAAREATGSILAFINNDMKADVNWLSRAVPLLSESPCVASRILDWNGEKIDFNGSSLQYLGYALQKDIGEVVKEVSHDDRLLFPCGGAMLIDRDTFLEAGGFDEDFFAIYEDVDLGWRLWILGHSVAFAPESKVFHRGHASFDSLHSAKMRYLMHRNALLTIFKNYEQENLKKIFPIALALAIKRAVRCSGVNKESFYIWEETTSGILNGDENTYLQVLDSLNHLVSVEDALFMLPRMTPKREEIQASRCRRDSEILELFQDPLRPIVEDREYISAELDFIHMMDLDAFFDTESYTNRARQFPDMTSVRNDRSRNELRRLQWLGGKALSQPGPSVGGSRWKKFFVIRKESGLKDALRFAVEAIRRAV